MDYIKNLRKIRKALLESPSNHAQAPMYKMLTYKNALDDFVSKEYIKFCTDVIGTVPVGTVSDEKEETKKANQILKLRVSTNTESLSKTEKEMSDMVASIFGHSNSTGELLKNYYLIENL